MSAGRQRVLAAVARALGRAKPDAATRAALERRLAWPKPNLIPKRAQLQPAECVDLFVAMAEDASATVTRLPTAVAAPAAVAEYLRRENLPAQIRIAPDPALEGLPWASRPLLRVSRGRTTGGDAVSLTGAFAGIAETGTLMLLSGPASPTTLNFLPDTHIVLLRADRVVGAYEEAWALLRRATDGVMPRSVNLITGPSRSADIEQTLQLGAHGPRRLHILLIDGGATA